MTGEAEHGVVVVGGGHAAAHLAMSLRKEGYTGPLRLLCEERHQPYQRPPLSKDFLDDVAAGDTLPLRSQRYWDDHGVEVRSGVRATRLLRESRRVELDDGTTLPYGHVVLATGASPRTPNIPGVDLPGVHVLRTRDDCDHLRQEIRLARRVVVVGAGFVGLEVAAAARRQDCAVTVLEAREQAMGRIVTEPVATHIVGEHRRDGVDLRFGTTISRIVGGEHASSVHTHAGESLPCDLVVLGVGVEPRDELARGARLACDDGVIVDETLRTTDLRVSAIGDCASFPCRHAEGRRVRLESVQNATDQARQVAAGIAAGYPNDMETAWRPYDSVPWFWSVQHGMRLQIAGLTDRHDTTVLRGDPAAGSFSNFCFRGDTLLGVESVNRPRDHMLARSVLREENNLTPEVVADPARDLRGYRPQCDTSARATNHH